MSRSALLGAFVFVVAGLSGCASPAKLIRSDQTTAVVAIPDDTNTWPFYNRDAAQAAAAERITEPFLVSTTRVKVGEQTTNTQDTTRRDLGSPDKRIGEVVTSTNKTSTSDTYEYHLEFHSQRPRVTTVTTRPADMPALPGTAGGLTVAPGTPPPVPGPGAPPIPSNPNVVPVSGIAPRNELLPATDIKMPTSPSSTSLPSTNITVPGR